jgi:hypothetical protein
MLFNGAVVPVGMTLGFGVSSLGSFSVASSFTIAMGTLRRYGVPEGSEAVGACTGTEIGVAFALLAF